MRKMNTKSVAYARGYDDYMNGFHPEFFLCHDGYRTDEAEILRSCERLNGSVPIAPSSIQYAEEYYDGYSSAENDCSDYWIVENGIRRINRTGS